MMDQLIMDELIQNALREDLTWGDITSDNFIDPNLQCDLNVFLKADGVIAGLEIAHRSFLKLDPQVQWETLHSDGTWLQSGTVVAKVTGNAQALLKAERVALNFLQRTSGIATLTHQFVQEAKKGSETVRLVDTRKTTPGLRPFEKYAVLMGGGHNHRYNLSDAVMLKDNHLALIEHTGQNLRDALIAGKKKLPHTVKVEVEVDRIDQIDPLLEAGVDIILLDNMNCDQLREAVQKIDGQAITEASGGVNLDTVADIAATGVDVISVGALTHSAKVLDISLDFHSIH